MEQKYKQIKIFEREEIYFLHNSGKSMREIGSQLGRHHSSIARELARNGKVDGKYSPNYADKKAFKRKHDSHFKLDRYPDLRRQILHHLVEDKWSPDAIAGRLKAVGQNIRVCAETIYNWLYNSAQSLQRALYKHLPRQQHRRCKLSKRRRKRQIIQHRTPIHQRSQLNNERLENGHLEADLVMFGKNKQNLITLIDRKTRYLTIINNVDGKNAINVINKIREKTMNNNIKSITFDNGLEFAKHHLLNKFGVDTFFCDPYSSWQKGSIEHANGLIRRFLPKNFNPVENNLSDNFVDIVQFLINNTPRKSLGYCKPAELNNCRTST
jgi:IS30 family transposase